MSPSKCRYLSLAVALLAGGAEASAQVNRTAGHAEVRVRLVPPIASSVVGATHAWRVGRAASGDEFLVVDGLRLVRRGNGRIDVARSIFDLLLLAAVPLDRGEWLFVTADGVWKAPAFLGAPTWLTARPPDADVSPRSAPGRLVFREFGGGRLWTTTGDGPLTRMEVVPNVPTYDVAFVDRERGCAVVVGRRTLVTDDGGALWQPAAMAEWQPRATDGGCIAYPGQGSDDSVVGYSDGALAPREDPVRAPAERVDIDSDSLRRALVGTFGPLAMPRYPRARGACRPQASTPGVELWDASCTEDRTFYGLGGPTDHPELWVGSEANLVRRDVPDAVRSVSFADAKRGLAVGANDREAWITHDGGRTWLPLGLPRAAIEPVRLPWSFDDRDRPRIACDEDGCVVRRALDSRVEFVTQGWEGPIVVDADDRTIRSPVPSVPYREPAAVCGQYVGPIVGVSPAFSRRLTCRRRGSIELPSSFDASGTSLTVLGHPDGDVVRSESKNGGPDRTRIAWREDGGQWRVRSWPDQAAPVGAPRPPRRMDVALAVLPDALVLARCIVEPGPEWACVVGRLPAGGAFQRLDVRGVLPGAAIGVRGRYDEGVHLFVGAESRAHSVHLGPAGHVRGTASHGWIHGGGSLAFATSDTRVDTLLSWVSGEPPRVGGSSSFTVRPALDRPWIVLPMSGSSLPRASTVELPASLPTCRGRASPESLTSRASVSGPDHTPTDYPVAGAAWAVFDTRDGRPACLRGLSAAPYPASTTQTDHGFRLRANRRGRLSGIYARGGTLSAVECRASE